MYRVSYIPGGYPVFSINSRILIIGSIPSGWSILGQSHWWAFWKALIMELIEITWLAAMEMKALVNQVKKRRVVLEMLRYLRRCCFINCSVLYLLSLELQGVATSTRVLSITASPVRGFAQPAPVRQPGFWGWFPLRKLWGIMEKWSK